MNGSNPPGRPPCYALREIPGTEGFRLRKEIPAGNGINMDHPVNEY